MPGNPDAFVDPRGTRFGGALTLLATLAALLSSSWVAVGAASLILLAAAVGGNRFNLWSYAYRWTLRPRLKPPEYLEPAAPPRFAQLLGGLFLSGAAVAFALGAAVWGFVLGGVVAALSFVNAAFDFCVGCRLYGLLVRLPIKSLRPDRS